MTSHNTSEQKPLKILNLYAGIGGNRKLWGDEHEITAVENVDYIADVYAHFYPKDTLVREDAHQYLLDHHKEFDFIWSSPPCPTHSKTNTFLNPKGYVRYPDMRLYQEIIFLKQWAYEIKWVVENVEPYYKPLIHAQLMIERHLFWANFGIPPLKLVPFEGNLEDYHYRKLEQATGITLPEGTKGDKRLMLRDITRPEIGAHILKAAQREVKQGVLL